MVNTPRPARPYVVVTNDDSVDSPLLAILIDALKNDNDLLVVAPAQEQSWKGKSMTRRGVLQSKEIYIGDTKCWAVDGTPADCANIAIHNIANKKPDFVVSGVNIGKNIGVGFSLASGTIGACFEANIAGIPAIALSQEFFPEDFKYWDRNRSFSETTRNVVLPKLRLSIVKVFDFIKNKCLKQPITWNVNFPKNSDKDDFTLKKTILSKAYYEDCFIHKRDGYEFALAKTSIEHHNDSDVAALEQGKISITELDIRILGQKLNT